MRAGDVVWADGMAWQAWWLADDWWAFPPGHNESVCATVFELQGKPDFRWLVRDGKLVVEPEPEDIVRHLRLEASSLRHPSRDRHSAAQALDAVADWIEQA